MTDNKNLPAKIEDVADVMLAETAASNPLLRFVKGAWVLNGEDIDTGTEFVAYPFDTMRGFARWEDNAVVEQRLNRIADRVHLEREELPEDQDWKPQHAMPLESADTGEVCVFVTGSHGGKKAINDLINKTARAVKSGRSDATPLIRLAVGSFPSKQYGDIPCPVFEIIKEDPKEVGGGTKGDGDAEFAKPSSGKPFNDEIPY
jgi:hypothetical protein